MDINVCVCDFAPDAHGDLFLQVLQLIHLIFPIPTIICWLAGQWPVEFFQPPFCIILAEAFQCPMLYNAEEA